MSGPRAQRVSFAPTLATLFLLTATISVPGPASALAESLGPAEHVLPDAEGFRPELWSPDGSMLVLTRDHRDIRILETESGLLWDVYSVAVPSPVRIPIAWDSTGTALRFLDYPAEAIRTYETKSGALSAFHLRDPFLLREVWRGIEAPETRAIVWWDPVDGEWKQLGQSVGAGAIAESKLVSRMDGPSIDSSHEWMAWIHPGSGLLSDWAIADESRSLKPLHQSAGHMLPVDRAGRLPVWQPDASSLWFVRARSGQDELMSYDPVAARGMTSSSLLRSVSLGPLTGGQVLHIAIAPGGKRIAWLTPTGLYTAPIQ